MDYLDMELMQYQNEQEHRCERCGEYCDEEWTCECDEHLGI
jgi:hypothetical protein